MVNLDKSLISVFKADERQPELMQVMRDLSTLSGVIQDLSSEKYFNSPLYTLRFLRILNLINEEALGLTEQLENEYALYYRYRNNYEHDSEITLTNINQLIFILGKYNWITKTTKRIRMRDVGKRMMDTLIRLANDSLAYYLNDDVAKSLFQAKRDAELSEAYDDKGISGGNKLVSMIKNVEDAIELLKERQLEYLADRNALPQVQIINQLMQELENKLAERIEKFQTFEEGLTLAPFMQRGTAIMAEGTKISIGTINKILTFSMLQQSHMIQAIQPETFRQFIMKSFDSPIESDIPDTHQILSFMEQGNYDEEELDGVWVPVKFPSPIPAQGINEAVEYIENYEPYTEEMEEVLDVEYEEMEELDMGAIDELMGDSRWQLTKQYIQTEQIEAYLEQVNEAGMEELVIEAGGSAKWSDVLNALIGVSALVSNQRASVDEPTNKEIMNKKSAAKSYSDKDWMWIDDEQGQGIVRRNQRGS